MNKSLQNIALGAVKETRQLFEQYDFDKDGSISIDELRQLLKAMGNEFAEEELAKGFKAVDRNSDGAIDFSEFIQLMSDYLSTDPKKAIREAFNTFDDDCDGLISKDELKIVIQSLHKRVTDQELDGVIAEISADAEHGIGFVEFAEILAILINK